MNSNLDSETKKTIEAALFISPNPLTLDELSKIVKVGSIGYVKRILNDIIEYYKNNDTALSIQNIDDKYIFTLKDEYMNKVSYLAAKPDISNGALKILAYISKNEPVIQSQIIKIFGAQSYAYIKELHDADFLEESKFGRTKKLKTTKKFREYFQLNK